MGKEKYDEFSKRPAKKLPKWFGERPGKKKGDPETPEGEEDAEAAPADESTMKKRRRMRRNMTRRRNKLFLYFNASMTFDLLGPSFSYIWKISVTFLTG